MRMIVLPFLALTACTTFPELDAVVSDEARASAYPTLIPLDDLTDTSDAVLITDTTVQELDNRLSRLRARAARLRGPVIDAPTRARMLRGVQ